MIINNPDPEAFERVCRDMASKVPLNLKDLVDIFGWPFIELWITSSLYTVESTEKLRDFLRDKNAKA